MEKGELLQLNMASDLGLSVPYGLLVRSSRGIAVSYLEGPRTIWLSIPQGWYFNRYHFPGD